MSNFPPSVAAGGIVGAPAKMDAWCGLSIDTRTSTVYSEANGGHADYGGNEVDAMALEVDSPVWVERLPPSAAGTFTPNNDNSARYDNGMPVSAHTYYSQQYIERRNRAMRFGVGAVFQSGYISPAIDGFDTTVSVGTNGWDAADAYPSWPAFDYNVPICKNPKTEDVFAFMANYSVYKWTEAANTTEVLGGGYPPASMQFAATAYDTMRDRIFLLCATACHTYDPATLAFTAQTLTGAPASTLLGGGWGMVYEPALDAYLLIGPDAGGTVYKVDASTFASTVLTTTGSPPSTNNGQPPYTRFLYAPNLSGVVWYPQYSYNAWFLRTR